MTPRDYYLSSSIKKGKTTLIKKTQYFKAALVLSAGFILLFGWVSGYAAYPKLEFAGEAALAEAKWTFFMKYYLGQAGVIVALTISVVSFLWVGYSVLAKFNDARTGRAEMSEVLVLGLVSAALLMIIAVILNQSSSMTTELMEVAGRSSGTRMGSGTETVEATEQETFAEIQRQMALLPPDNESQLATQEKPAMTREQYDVWIQKWAKEQAEELLAQQKTGILSYVTTQGELDELNLWLKENGMSDTFASIDDARKTLDSVNKARVTAGWKAMNSLKAVYQLKQYNDMLQKGGADAIYDLPKSP